MKMRFKGLALTAMFLSGTSMTFAQQGASVGDLPESSVGDLPGFGEEAYFHEEATYAPANYVGDAPPIGFASSPTTPFNPTGVAEFEPASYGAENELQTVSALAGSACDAADFGIGLGAGIDGCNDCNGDCVDPCDTCDNGFSLGKKLGLGNCDLGLGDKFGLGKGGKLFRVFDKFDNCTWAQAEFLTWWLPDRDMPALVTTSNPGTAPVLPEGGANNVAVVWGDPIEGEITGGLRGDIGRFVTKNVGIGGRLWFVADSNDSFFAAGDGTSGSIGRPFFNTDSGTSAEDALLIALAGTFTGSVAGDSSLEMWAAEAYSRFRFSCNDSCRLDFIAGYSHFEIDDTLSITSATITNATARTRIFNDLFETENRFNGGQMGFEMVMTRGRWMARSLTKIHLGNMEQNYRIVGTSSDQTPPGAATLTSGGVLALGNQGNFERDEWSFIPEANFKLGYRVHKNALLSVGYTFMYYDNVALTGDVVDRLVDGTAFNTGAPFPAHPAFKFADSSIWVQGLDLGIVVDF